MPSLATNKDKSSQPQFKGPGKEKETNNRERKKGERKTENEETPCAESGVLLLRCQASSALLCFQHFSSTLNSPIVKIIYFLHQTLISFIIWRHIPKWWCSKQDWPELKAVYLLFIPPRIMLLLKNKVPYGWLAIGCSQPKTLLYACFVVIFVAFFSFEDYPWTGLLNSFLILKFIKAILKWKESISILVAHILNNNHYHLLSSYCVSSVLCILLLILIWKVKS